ncbi:hypothetical protein SprV_0702422400 [Sparganum proliferum]
MVDCVNLSINLANWSSVQAVFFVHFDALLMSNRHVTGALGPQRAVVDSMKLNATDVLCVAEFYVTTDDMSRETTLQFGKLVFKNIDVGDALQQNSGVSAMNTQWREWTLNALNQLATNVTSEHLIRTYDL